ncbi:MAG: DUF2786 domain-containing protein [Acidimicrobiales bacterium]
MKDSPLPTLKVRALLDKAESTAFPEEAEALVAKAAELMARYRITQAMLEATSPGMSSNGSEPIVEHRIEMGKGPYVLARLSLLSVCAESQSCRVLTMTGWEGRIAFVIGHLGDTRATEILYTSLLVQATLGASRVVPRGRTSSVTVRRNYLVGFAEGISERLKTANDLAEAEAEARRHPSDSGSVAGFGASARPESGWNGPKDSGSPTVALVLADRSARVDDWVRSAYPRLGRSQTISVSIDGFTAGRSDASRADLNHRRVGRPARALGA